MKKPVAQNHAFLTTPEVCELLRISEKTLQRWRKDRKLTYIRRGGRFLFRSTDLDNFLAQRTVRHKS
jgi:excisionase family DNA binding protein